MPGSKKIFLIVYTYRIIKKRTASLQQIIMRRALLLTAFLLIISFSFSQENGGLRQTPLLSFEAKTKSGNIVLLSWSTSAENTMSHFVVQRSIDENNFDDQAIIFTEQNIKTPKRKYKFPDRIDNTNSNVLYYRLKLVGLDGDINYSAVKKIKLKKKY